MNENQFGKLERHQFEKLERKKQSRRLLVVSLRKQHHLFVREGLDDTEEDLSDKPNDLERDTSYENWKDRSDVTNQFRLGFLTFQVKPNEQVVVFKNGVPLPQFLGPGRHTLFNKDPFFTRYQIYRFNTQVVTLKALIDGRAHDPKMRLDLRVIAEFRILCRLKYYRRFLLEVDKPLRLLYTIFNDIVYDELGKIEHDLLGKWASELRNRVLERLQGNSSKKGQVEELIGIEIVDVLVDSLANNEMYVDLQDENFAFQAELYRDVAKAQAEQQQATALGIDPALIRFQGTNMGNMAIQGQVDLRKIQALFPSQPSASGNQPSDSIRVNPVFPSPPSSSLINPPVPTPLIAGPSSSLINPPVPTPLIAGPSSEDNVSQQLGAEDNSVSEERQEQEINALRQAGFVPNGRGGRSGPLAAPYWDLAVTTRLPNSDLLTIAFRCDGNYPYRPPTVFISSRAHGRRVLQELESLLNWDFHMMLVEIAEEVRRMLLAESAGGS